MVLYTAEKQCVAKEAEISFLFGFSHSLFLFLLFFTEASLLPWLLSGWHSISPTVLAYTNIIVNVGSQRPVTMPRMVKKRKEEGKAFKTASLLKMEPIWKFWAPNLSIYIFLAISKKRRRRNGKKPTWRVLYTDSCQLSTPKSAQCLYATTRKYSARYVMLCQYKVKALQLFFFRFSRCLSRKAYWTWKNKQKRIHRVSFYFFFTRKCFMPGSTATPNVTIVTDMTQ